MIAGPLYLARARLKTGRGEVLSAISPALLNGSKGQTVGHAHRILWMLFQGRAEGEERDFLWREERPGQYMILSRRPPSDPHSLFDLKHKEFAPELSAGDVLSFELRANPVVHRKAGWEPSKEKRDGKGRVRGMRCDIVMDALSSLPGRMRGEAHGETARAKHRHDLTKSAARAWIDTQSEKNGFRLVINPENDEPYLDATNYETIKVPRMNGSRLAPSASFGVLDFSGLIEVTDPEVFVARLGQGFGKAKAFGCGLMLIRRAGVSHG